MKQRKVKILCVQEVRWRGGGVREIGEGYKLYYSGSRTGRNGVGIILDDELKQRVMEVQRPSDRLMTIKVLAGKSLINIVSGYAPQIGCEDQEKEEFKEQLEQSVREIPEIEEIILGADLNCHVGETGGGYEACHGGIGYSPRNKEGERMIKILGSLELVLVNTGFKKRDEHLTTYRSGDSSSQIVFLVVRKRTRKNMRDAKVIPGEAVAHQHRLLVMHGTFSKKRKEVQEKIKEKKKAFKEWRDDKESLEKRNRYKVAKRETKRAVAVAKEEAVGDWYTEMETPEGEKRIYKVDKQRARAKTDIPKVTVEMSAVLKKIKKNKSAGTSEMLDALGSEGAMWTHEIWNGENIPEDWRTSILVPIYKQNGDVLKCGNHRGIKLLEHLLKDTYESVIIMVRTPQGTSEEFEVNVGLHQGSSLSPLLFIIVIDVNMMSNNILKATLCNLHFKSPNSNRPQVNVSYDPARGQSTPPTVGGVTKVLERRYVQ
ncbi:craniofacial development protein 2-like [Penaeus indicus]|uniref:craniofacial development protein 2-like n=1 Tax=Penaeus indicus TaxID=29960 RepID=UPI00300DBA3C